MSDTISVRIDLGTAKLEFAGMHIEQPIGITLDLPREKIAEIILGGASIRPVVADVKPAPVPAVASQPEPAPKRSSMVFGRQPEPDAPAAAPVVIAIPERRRASTYVPARKGKMSTYGDDYLREHLGKLTIAAAAAKFGCSTATISNTKRRLGMIGEDYQPPKVEVPEVKSFTDYSDVELRTMLASRQWSSVAFQHGVSITAVISEGKRLGVSAPAKEAAEVARADTTFRISSAEGTPHVHA